jgi:clan AA aspartic protease
MFLDAADSPLAIDLSIDTGFAGFLALPRALIVQLNLPLLAEIDLELADGSLIARPCYEARVIWQGQVRAVRAFDLGREAIVGINFLWGHRLTIDIKVGGDVTVDPLP